MFEIRSTADLMQIAAAGGGFEIQCGIRSTADLMQIAAAAKRGGATVYLRGLGIRSTADLMQIAAAGRGHVVFADPLPDAK